MSVISTPPDLDAESQGAHSRTQRGHGFPWRTALREFIVIVTGVLVALAAQAWWESRQERAREHEYLRQLLAETRENESRIEQSITQDSAGGAALARIMAALGADAPVPTPDSIAAWVVRGGSVSDFQPLFGTYRALLGTGDLRLVQNDSLRALIVTYAAVMDQEDEWLRQLRVAFLNAVEPIARSMPFVRSAFLAGPDLSLIDVEALRENPDAAATLFSLQTAHVNRLRALRRAREETRRIRSALEVEPSLRAAGR